MAFRASSRRSPMEVWGATPRRLPRLESGSASMASTGPQPRSPSWVTKSAAIVVLPVPPLPATAMLLAMELLDVGMGQDHGLAELLDIVLRPHQVVVGGVLPDALHLAQRLAVEGHDLGSLNRGVAHELDAPPRDFGDQADG